MAGETGARAAPGAVVLEGVAVAGRPGFHDVRIDGGRIAGIAPSAARDGGVVTPLLADIHVHLDKTHTIGRIGFERGARIEGLFDAIAMMDEDRRRWNAADIRARAERALRQAYANGVGVMRTHVDWVRPEVPEAWPVMVELRQEWSRRIDLQLAALVPGDLIPEAGEGIAGRVARDGGVLGAFFYRNAALAEKVEAVFGHARAFDLDLDFHVDEGLDEEADGVSLIVEATARQGWARRVLCGHACSLSLRSGETLKRSLDAAAEAGVALVALPTTNLYLQDRRLGRAPRRRGIAPLAEARAAGMTVMLASDNVADAFYPYGDYDPLSVLRLAVPACHLEPVDWLEAIAGTPARWVAGGQGPSLAAGEAANFIWHDAADLGDLIARPRAGRVVYRDGSPLSAEAEHRRNA